MNHPTYNFPSLCASAGMNSPSMATKEVKNGRLAMTAFIGFAVQASRSLLPLVLPALLPPGASTAHRAKKAVLQTPAGCRCCDPHVAGTGVTVSVTRSAPHCPAAQPPTADCCCPRAPQALLTRQGPIEALQSHLSAPFDNNFIGSILNLPNVIGQ